jgi:hypothetical protein
MFSLSNLLKWVNIFLWLPGEDQGKGDDSRRVDEEVKDLFLFVFPCWSRVFQSEVQLSVQGYTVLELTEQESLDQLTKVICAITFLPMRCF